MANDMMEILRRALQGQDTQSIQPPMAPIQPEAVPEVVQDAQVAAENAKINEQTKSANLMKVPELAQQEAQKEADKTVAGQLQKRAVASQVDNPVAKVSSLQELLNRRNEIETQKMAEMKTATEDDKKRALMATIAKSLGGLGAANIQAQTGQRVGLKDPTPVNKIDTASAIGKEKDSLLNRLKEDYQLMQSSKKDELTPIQKAQLADKDKDRALKEKIALFKDKSSGKKPSEFDKALAKKQADDFATSQVGLEKTSAAVSAVDDAIAAQLDYSKNKLGGTGPISTAFGLTKYLSGDTEALDAKFKAIDLKNMVTTFSGMSKAVDSDAERRAWKATQASVSNDDETNLIILLGSKSTLLKHKAIAEAKAQWVKEHDDLRGFTHPILKGDVTTLVDPSGKMILVNKNEVKDYKKQGYQGVDSFADGLLSKKKAPEYVTLISPDGEEARVRKDQEQKYLDNGASRKE